MIGRLIHRDICHIIMFVLSYGSLKALPHNVMLYTHDGTFYSSFDVSKLHGMFCDAFAFVFPKSVIPIYCPIFKEFVAL